MIDKTKRRTKEKPVYITVNYTLFRDEEYRNGEHKIPLSIERLSTLDITKPDNSESKAIENIIRSIMFLRGYKEMRINKILRPEVTINE